MKNLFKKDIALFFGDKKTVLLTFVLPLFLVSIFTVAFSGLRSDKQSIKAKINTVKIAVVDEDISVASQTILSELRKEPILSITTVDSLTAFNALKVGKLMGVLHIKEGFMDSYLKKRQTLNWSFNYLTGSEFQINVFKSFFVPMMEKMGRKYNPLNNGCTNNSMSLSFNAVSGAGKEEAKPYNDPWLVQPIIGIAIILLLFNTINIGGHFIDEYNNKTLNRLLLSPIKYHSFLLSKFLMGFFVCVLQFILILVFAKLCLGLKLFNLPIIGLLVIVSSFSCTSFYLLLTSISKTRNQLNSLSIAGVLFLSAIGGSMMPNFIMPSIMQKISQFSINYWVLESFFDVLWRRTPFFQSTFSNVMILLAISFSLLLFSTLFFRKRFFHL